MLKLKELLKNFLPKPIFNSLAKCYHFITTLGKTKYDAELEFWMSRLKLDNGVFENSHYRKILLSMAEMEDSQFLTDKIVGDFGCGPRGSLCWAKEAFLRIGIDVLVDKYAENFKSNLINHNMIYVKSTESVIPMPSNFCDFIFSLNALDHVDNFPAMIDEISRILKPNGEFIVSFNLEEKRTICEPQTLTEKFIQENVLNKFDVISRRISEKGPGNNAYGPFFENKLKYEPGKEGFLWLRLKKKLIS